MMIQQFDNMGAPDGKIDSKKHSQAQRLRECFLGTAHVKMFDLVTGGEKISAIKLRFGSVNPRPLDKKLVAKIAKSLVLGNVYCREHPLIACVEEGDIENLKKIVVDDEYDAGMTLPTVEWSAMARAGKGLQVLGGHHRFCSAQKAAKTLLPVWTSNKAKLEKAEVVLKEAKRKLAVYRAAQHTPKRETNQEKLEKTESTLLAHVTTLQGDVEELTEDVDVSEGIIREIQHWPFLLYSKGEFFCNVAMTLLIYRFYSQVNHRGRDCEGAVQPPRSE